MEGGAREGGGKGEPGSTADKKGKVAMPQDEEDGEHRALNGEQRTRNRRKHGHDNVIFQHPVQRVTKEVGSAIKPEKTAKQEAEESKNLSSAAGCIRYGPRIGGGGGGEKKRRHRR